MKWIDVKQELPVTKPSYANGPMTSARVLVSNGRRVEVGYYDQTYKTRKFRWLDAIGSNVDVTHWMPLPPPPTTK